MSDPWARPPRTLAERWLSRAELWIYEANEHQNAIFQLYDLANEWWARLFFGRIKRASRAFRVDLEGRTRRGSMRLLTTDDLDAFADLLARFDFKYLPPHALDRASAEAALRRSSYITLGVFQGGELGGYLLLRLFAPKRSVLGIWSRSDAQNQGFTKIAIRHAAEFTTAHGFPNYITVPVDNVYSLRASMWAGWRVVRSNPRFHVLLFQPDAPLPAEGLPGGAKASRR